METLVRTGLVPSYADAGDLLVTGFQNGADRAGDLNTTLTNNAGVLKDMGFSGEGAMNLIVTGLDNGYDSAGELVNQLLIVRQRLVENSDQVQTALDTLGQTDEADAYPERLHQRRAVHGRAGRVHYPMRRKSISSTSRLLYSGRAGRAGCPPNRWRDWPMRKRRLKTSRATSKKRAACCSPISIPTVQRIFRKAEDRVAAFLSSDQIDLPGKIAAIEAAFNTFLDQLEAGSGVGEALEIAIDVPGLADQISHFESVVGNLFLDLGEFAAQIADAVGNSTLAAQIRDSIRPVAEGQLSFDLDVATSQEDVMAAVSTAAARGLSSEQVNAALDETIQNAFASGDFAGLQTLSDSISTLESESAVDVDALAQSYAGLLAERDQITGSVNLGTRVAGAADPARRH
jgi:hypothetical protein